MLLKIRGRLALRLARPFLEPRFDRASAKVEARDSGGSWGPGFWIGQHSGMYYLVRDMRLGRRPDFEEPEA